jgi:hypothetical protein
MYPKRMMPPEKESSNAKASRRGETKITLRFFSSWIDSKERGFQTSTIWSLRNFQMDREHRVGQQDEDAERRRILFKDVIESIGGLNAFKGRGADIKFWLPQPAADALKEIKVTDGDSMNTILQDFLVGHCYGFWLQQALSVAEASRSRSPAIFCTPGLFDSLDRKKRNTVYFVPELGKNIFPVKIWIPKQLKSDLSVLAEQAELTLSAYVREIIVSHLFGHGMLPKRPEMFVGIDASLAEKWIEGGDVPWRKVISMPEDDLSIIGEYKTREVYVDNSGGMVAKWIRWLRIWFDEK